MEKGGNKGQELPTPWLFCKKEFTAWLWGGNSGGRMFLECFKNQTPPLTHTQMERMHFGDAVFKTFGLCIVCLLVGTRPSLCQMVPNTLKSSKVKTFCCFWDTRIVGNSEIWEGKEFIFGCVLLQWSGGRTSNIAEEMVRSRW